MLISSSSFVDGCDLQQMYAWADCDPVGNRTPRGNRNPELNWTDAPAGTKSFAVILVDPDVPAVRDNVNVAGRTISADTPRTEMCHWVLIDLPANISSIVEGEFSDGVVKGGKDGPDAPLFSRQGINGFTAFMSTNPDMNGNYFGYDGPSPPGNDERKHRYIFTLYALDIAHLPLGGIFDRQAVAAAMDGHILATATITGLYSAHQ